LSLVGVVVEVEEVEVVWWRLCSVESAAASAFCAAFVTGSAAARRLFIITIHSFNKFAGRNSAIVTQMMRAGPFIWRRMAPS
jgi:hypothetical protein